MTYNYDAARKRPELTQSKYDNWIPRMQAPSQGDLGKYLRLVSLGYEPRMSHVYAHPKPPFYPSPTKLNLRILVIQNTHRLRISVSPSPKLILWWNFGPGIDTVQNRQGHTAHDVQLDMTVKQPWPRIIDLVSRYLAAFYAIQASTRLCPEPTIPPRLFSNRTSLAAFILSFLHGTLLYWTIYFLPVYFQSVLQSSPTRSGVQLLPTVIVVIRGAIAGGVLITKTGRYKPIQIAGFALMTLGLGLFTLLDESSSTGAWVGFQIIAALGSGLIITSTLPAAQAELAESDVASSTATWAFLRSFGSVWGVAIPAAIFNNRFLAALRTAGVDGDSRVALAALLDARNAYQEASGEIIASLPPELRPVVVGVYAGALKWVWRVSVIFAGLGFLVAWMEREVELRTTLETEFGLDDDGVVDVVDGGNEKGGRPESPAQQAGV
ncbi:major facilitator superfamily domain-containing protein [Aspergillus fruticulosus]